MNASPIGLLIDRRNPAMTEVDFYRIYGDRWNGVLNDEWHIDTPSVDDLNRVLDRLDAKIYTMVIIQGFGEQHMAIGGGAGRYVVYATFDNEEFWSLLAPRAGDSIVPLNVGGQQGDYPATQVVNLEQARAAAQRFFLQGELDSGQKWDRR
jgi:hypothetical protein